MSYFQSIKLRKKDLPEELGWDGRRKEIDKPVQSGFDYEEWPIIRNSYTTGGLKLEIAHWEFIPFWINGKGELEEMREKHTTLNARGETLLTNRYYAKAARERRCLMLSSGFYEWRYHKGVAYPYFITVKGKEVFYQAGVWSSWTDKESGERMITFALITTAANKLLSQIHNKKKRMPVILTDELKEEWMQKNLPENRIKEIATFQFPSENLEAYTVAKDFRESIDPQRPVDYPGLPPLK
jgi:putative SOS response-associated peptidase YedK